MVFKVFSKGDQVKVKLTNLKLPETKILGKFFVFKGILVIYRERGLHVADS